jgi:hypothetical protein
MIEDSGENLLNPLHTLKQEGQALIFIKKEFV